MLFLNLIVVSIICRVVFKFLILAMNDSINFFHCSSLSRLTDLQLIGKLSLLVALSHFKGLNDLWSVYLKLWFEQIWHVVDVTVRVIWKFNLLLFTYGARHLACSFNFAVCSIRHAPIHLLLAIISRHLAGPTGGGLGWWRLLIHRTDGTKVLEDNFKLPLDHLTKLN